MESNYVLRYLPRFEEELTDIMFMAKETGKEFFSNLSFAFMKDEGEMI